MFPADLMDFDLTPWERLLDTHDPWKYTQDCVTSPFCMAMHERVRRDLGLTPDLPGCVRADVFLFSAGPPPRRDLTQIGGLPYRAANRPWPVGPDGKRLRFLAQIRFRESRDLVPQAGGDLLLIFASPQVEVDDWRMEWQSLDVPESELVGPEHDPVLLEKFRCFGHRYRTVDYPPGTVETNDMRTYVLAATKIGGIEVSKLSYKRWSNGDYLCEEGPKNAGYFATLASCQALIGHPYPWIDRERPIDYTTEHSDSYTFSLYDLWVASLCLRPDGSFDYPDFRPS